MQLLSSQTDFLEKGFLVFQITNLNELELFENITFKSVENDDASADEAWIPLEFKKDLISFAQQLTEKLVQPYYPATQIINASIWDGVDMPSTKWHNDCYSPTSLNSSLLVYLDNPSQKQNGSLFIQGNGHENRIETHQGKIVWMNQTHKFRHRAERSPDRRRMVGIDLYIPDIAYLTSFHQKEETHGSTT